MSPQKLQQLFDQALAHHRAGRLKQAAAVYREILRLQPNHPDAFNFLGLTVQQQGDHTRAIELFSKAIHIRPRAPFFRLNQGNSLRDLGRLDEAIAEYRTAAGLDPTSAEAHHQLGNALKSQGHYGEASGCLREAARLDPDNAANWTDLGIACLQLKDHREAVACFQRSLKIQPADPDVHNLIGHILFTNGLIADAKRHLSVALRLEPGHADAHNSFAQILRAQGRMAEAIGHYKASLARDPKPSIHSNLVYALNYLPDLSPGEIWAEHRRWAELYAEPCRKSWVLHPNDFSPHRRLRIGYVSPDLVNHAVASFLEPVLIAHDRERFDVFAYSNAIVGDRVTERLRAQTGHWREIAHSSDDQVEALIREDRIDILVDLAGHTGRNRLPLFARKPAPIQVTWLGYPNTTGMTAMDYRITESISDPPGLTDAWHSEKLIRLPGPFSCYQPPAESPPVARLPAIESGHVTFGCFNIFAKVTPRAIALWARLLNTIPEARLFLKSMGLTDPETTAQIHDGFAQQGIAPERIELNGDRLPVADQLDLYRRVDIALDTFPYNGTTTTCEALWMGIPVVTLAGRTHVSRAGASLLTHLGATEWIANTPDEYLDICHNLASDPPQLAVTRGALRERMRQSPLCDATRFTQNLEAAFREMWRSRCSALR
jgi:predicted O-linked N-acetylglucosamine transferase (SPINDLY family)